MYPGKLTITDLCKNGSTCIYAHVLPHMQQSAVNAMDRLLGPVDYPTSASSCATAHVHTLPRACPAVLRARRLPHMHHKQLKPSQRMKPLDRRLCITAALCGIGALLFALA